MTGDTNYGQVSMDSIKSSIQVRLSRHQYKPKEYHLPEQHYEMLVKDISVLKRGFRSSFIYYEDKRLNEVAKGYVIQAVCYHFISNSFCKDRGYRLHNARWQEELIYAQLVARYEFCESHIGFPERRNEK